MKILILQDYLRSGGTERQSVLLANACAAAGHPTTLLTFRPGGALAATVAPVVTRRALQVFDLGLDWLAPGLGGAVAEAAPDVILCMGRMANCAAGGLQKKFPGTAVIATMRTGKPLPGRFRRSLAVVPRIVANSRDARDTLVRDYGVPAAKISVIYNSLVFPAESSLARHTELRTRYGAGPGTLVLLCVAMFRPEKNQRELVEIAAGLDPALDWQLWLAGEGPARADCARLARELGHADRVKFLGFHRNPSPLYAAADIAVHASSSEALSNFLIEAQAHGLPAVAYAAQGIEECFVPGQTGWAIARNDRASFRAAVNQVAAATPESRHVMTTGARDYARHTFDPGRQVAAYLDLFRELTARSAS
jgi:glycosyltransferase involved in cell wall biosynthesis